MSRPGPARVSDKNVKQLGAALSANMNKGQSSAQSIPWLLTDD